MPSNLNEIIRGRFGALITEAAVVKERGVTFQNRVKGHAWTELDADEPVEHMVPDWNTNKLNKALLWELAGLPGTRSDGDGTLEAELLRELGNREKVWGLMDAAVAAVKGGTQTAFMTVPLDEAQKAGCVKRGGGPIQLVDLMHILHMFGKKNTPHAPRPKHPIDLDDYFYATQNEVAKEIQRRVRELAAGIPWEGNVIGGKEKKKAGVWNRYGFYCGCGG